MGAVVVVAATTMELVGHPVRTVPLFDILSSTSKVCRVPLTFAHIVSESVCQFQFFAYVVELVSDAGNLLTIDQLCSSGTDAKQLYGALSNNMMFINFFQ